MDLAIIGGTVGLLMIDSTIDFASILSRLDRSLTREKFKVWREASWEDGSSMPLLGLRDSLLPWPHSDGVFLNQYEEVAVADIRDLAEQSLAYMQRTRPALLRSKLMTQYVIVPCLAAQAISEEAAQFVKRGDLPKYFDTDVPFPVLLDLSKRKIHAGEAVGVWEIPKRLATAVLDLGMTRV